MDMSRNLSLPFFSGEHPGEAYYYIPLTYYLFGIVNNSQNYLNVYLLHEGDGDRGDNNFVSCLVRYMKEKNFFTCPHYGELTVVADNCNGQNKNSIVLRYLMWLVERQIFPKVTLLFLVKGHTKNSCDRLFNCMKLDYNRQNTYTHHELVQCLNQNKKVSVVSMTPSDF